MLVHHHLEMRQHILDMCQFQEFESPILHEGISTIVEFYLQIKGVIG